MDLAPQKFLLDFAFGIGKTHTRRGDTERNRIMMTCPLHGVGCPCPAAQREDSLLRAEMSGRSVHSTLTEDNHSIREYPNGIVGFQPAGQSHGDYKEALKTLGANLDLFKILKVQKKP